MRIKYAILRRMYGYKKVAIIRYQEQIRNACDLLDKYTQEPIEAILENVLDKIDITKYIALWYVLVRRYKPDVVVETGVSMGWSTSMILHALNRNKKGKLYSIDIDSEQSVRDWGGVGYLVKYALRTHWHLTNGDSKEKLRPLLDKLGTIDMFIHDSAHNYDVMKFEYETAWKHLKSFGGILASDDINQSQAWQEFIESHGTEIIEAKTFLEKARETDEQFRRPIFGYCVKA